MYTSIANLSGVLCFSYLTFYLILIFSHPVYSQTYQSQPVEVGFRSFNYDGGGVNNEPTQEKPESKLWFHDGFWWGVLWEPTSGNSGFKIHRFDAITQNWTLLQVDVDSRRRSSADALWDGNKLYIVSRAKETHKDPEGPDTAILNRYSYFAASDSFGIDAGFPVEITGSSKTRAMTLAKDSTGKLWAVWTASDQVMINRTTTDDHTWGTPFVLPVQGNDLADIDLASIVAFGGTKVGILWSNQLDQKYYFAAHPDANADTLWDSREEALADSLIPEIADDHINIAVRESDGTLIAAVKTSTNGSTSVRIFVLKRTPSGEWSRHVYGLGGRDHTRPVALVHSETDSVYVFARSKDLHAIILKTAHLDNLSFPSGDGVEFIKSSFDSEANNPTATKQTINSESGILVLASVKDTKYYLHNYLDFSGNSLPVAVEDVYSVNEDSVLTVSAPGLLENDSDADGDTLIAGLNTAPVNGTLTQNSNGAFTYTPIADFSGGDSFTYSLNDGRGGFDTGTVLITVDPVNDSPVAVADTYNVAEDSTLAVGSPGVLSNDSDVDGDSLIAALTVGPVNGVLTLNGDGSLIYTPNANFTGVDSLTYLADDGNGGTATAVAMIMVAGGNDPPVAIDDVYSVAEDSVLVVAAPGVLDNDSDPDGDGLSATMGAAPVNGNLDLNSDGSFTYTPAVAFNGSDSFTYSLGDGQGGSDTATVTIEVSAVNDAPIAVDDESSTEMDETLAVAAPGVLANDFDLEGDELSALLGAGPASGQLTLHADGSYDYTPDPGFTGTDGFTYTARDSLGALSSLATVTIEVLSPSGSAIYIFEPTDDVHVRAENPTKNYRNRDHVRVDANDFQGYFKFDVQGLSGNVQSAKLQLYVTADSEDGGQLYSVSNNFEGSSLPWDEETLNASNAPAIEGPVLAGVGVAEMDSVVELDVTQAISSNGIFSFALSKTTPDRVEYASKETENPPLLVIEISGGLSNEPPVALDDSASTIQNVGLEIDVTGNDFDSDGTIDAASTAIVAIPSNGTCSVDAATGLVTYSPNAGFVGSDSFSYMVNDDVGASSNAALVTVQVGADTNITAFSFEPTDDARISLFRPSNNYGDKSSAKVDAGEFNSYFKFNVTGVVGTVYSARLRLYVTNESDGGGLVFSVSNNFNGTTTPWVEESLTANNAPEISGPSLADIGQVSINSFVEVEVTAAISGDGLYSFGIAPNSTDRVEYSTKEGEHAPELIINTEEGLAKQYSEVPADEKKESQKTETALPETISLQSNYPNPFNAETTIAYTLPRAAKVELFVYNTRGQVVRELVRGIEEPGYKKVRWNGKDERGRDVASGIYFLQLKIGKQNLTRKMILQK